jgi:hypothetical protein
MIDTQVEISKIRWRLQVLHALPRIMIRPGRGLFQDLATNDPVVQNNLMLRLCRIHTPLICLRNLLMRTDSASLVPASCGNTATAVWARTAYMTAAFNSRVESSFWSLPLSVKARTSTRICVKTHQPPSFGRTLACTKEAELFQIGITICLIRNIVLWLLFSVVDVF